MTLSNFHTFTSRFSKWIISNFVKRKRRYLLKLICQNSFPTIETLAIMKTAMYKLWNFKMIWAWCARVFRWRAGWQTLHSTGEQNSADTLRRSNHLVIVDTRLDGLGFFVKYISFPIFRLYMFIYSGFYEECIVFKLHMLCLYFIVGNVCFLIEYVQMYVINHL